MAHPRRAGALSKAKRARLGMSLIAAVQKMDHALARHAISLGADPSFPHVLGQDSPAMLACDVDRPDILSTLIDAGADLDAGNWIGSTACMRSAMGGSPRCLRLLILAGCDPERSEPSKLRRASHYAASFGQLECLSLLEHAGCDLQAATRSGDTPESLARAHGHVDCALFIQALVERRSLLAGGDPRATRSSHPAPRI